MNFFISQHIVINTIKIDSLTNSSVFQIGTAGMIKPQSSLYNTGGFTGAAPQIPLPGTSGTGETTAGATSTSAPSPTTAPVPFVPLVSPTFFR